MLYTIIIHLLSAIFNRNFVRIIHIVFNNEQEAQSLFGLNLVLNGIWNLESGKWNLESGKWNLIELELGVTIALPLSAK